MSGRESSVFSFDVDEWIEELVGRLKIQIKNHTDKLGKEIEQYVLTLSEADVSSMDRDAKREFKSNLRGDILQVTSSLGQFLEEALDTQSAIMEKYLREHVFYVPPDAILSISPLDVPIPAHSSDMMDVSTTSDKTDRKSSTKGGKSKLKEETPSESLKVILTQIHKSEYFLSRLKVLHAENEQYIQSLQNILHALLQLDETTKANDTESVVQLIIDTLQRSMLQLKSAQTELQKRGIDAQLNV